MRYFPKIISERLYLSPVNPEDAELYTKWLNDAAVSGNLANFSRVLSLSGERAFLEQMASDSGGQNYAIVQKENDRLLGNISLMSIDAISRKAEVGLFIGEEAHRGKGYGAEALRAILDYGFATLNLHNIMLLVHGDNPRAIACYKKVGFQEFGRRREAQYKAGRYVDMIYMDMLRSDFYPTK